MERRGGQNPGLTHGAAEHLPETPGRAHTFVRTDERGADRCPEALREANAERVERLSERLRRSARGDCGVPQPSTIHVHPEPASVRGLGKALTLSLRKDAAPARSVRVLDDDQRGLRQVLGSGLDRCQHLLGREQAAAPGDRELHPGPGSRRAAFEVHAVSALANHDLIAASRVHQERDLIGHCPRRHEQGTLLAQHLCDLCFQP
jgi:hypothetical protein